VYVQGTCSLLYSVVYNNFICEDVIIDNRRHVTKADVTNRQKADVPQHLIEKWCGATDVSIGGLTLYLLLCSNERRFHTYFSYATGSQLQLLN
jgi:hypothetical protein